MASEILEKLGKVVYRVQTDPPQGQIGPHTEKMPGPIILAIQLHNKGVKKYPLHRPFTHPAEPSLARALQSRDSPHAQQQKSPVRPNQSRSQSQRRSPSNLEGFFLIKECRKGCLFNVIVFSVQMF